MNDGAPLKLSDPIYHRATPDPFPVMNDGAPLKPTDIMASHPESKTFPVMNDGAPLKRDGIVRRAVLIQGLSPS